MRRAGALVVAAVLTVAAAPSASAHEERPVGPVRLVVGWLDEPAYAGDRNAVSVEVSRGTAPVDEAELEAVVIFGGRDGRTRTAPMRLRSESPGLYTAPLLPTQPGTYTFHVTGNVDDTGVDESFTSGDGTFDDVRDAASESFPLRVASTADLTKRLERAEARAASTARRAQIATGLAAAALALAVVALARRRRTT